MIDQNYKRLDERGWTSMLKPMNFPFPSSTVLYTSFPTIILFSSSTTASSSISSSSVTLPDIASFKRAKLIPFDGIDASSGAVKEWVTAELANVAVFARTKEINECIFLEKHRSHNVDIIHNLY